MNLGVTLKAAEKIFGPARPGPDTAENTLSAVRYAKGGAKKFAGIAGLEENAKFYIHFPTAVDWNLLTTKKGTPDFVSDLRESGPQGEQGREAQVVAFMERYEIIREKLRHKQEAVEKKASVSRRKAELVQFRDRLVPFAGEREATLLVGSESFSLPVKITLEKSGKIKITSIF
jgi:hypothetical protein